MEPDASRRNALILWLVIGGLAALIMLPLWGPLRVAWRCYQLHQHAPRERAQVLHKLENATLALQIVAGPHAGQSCTADTSLAIYEATSVREELEVVSLDWKPGECELSSTIEASAGFLWVISGGVGALLAGLLALGVVLHRSFTRPMQPRRRMQVTSGDVPCPACGKLMDEGYVPLLAGVHWRQLGDPVGLPHALHGLPGTVGWRERPRLHAFRCVPCEILTVQYGDPAQH